MTTSAGAPMLTARQIDDLRAWVRDPSGLDPAAREALAAVGVVVEDAVDPLAAGVVAVLERSWATFRLRRWCEGERVDLVGAVGPRGVALLAGPPGPDAARTLDHRPRWTGAARALAGFVGLGPVSAGDDGAVPAEVPWDDLLAATGDDPPAWASARTGPVAVTLWDLAWSVGGRRLTVLDLGGVALREATPIAPGSAVMALRPRRPEEVWHGLCHLMADLVPATSSTVGER